MAVRIPMFGKVGSSTLRPPPPFCCTRRLGRGKQRDKTIRSRVNEMRDKIAWTSFWRRRPRLIVDLSSYDEKTRACLTIL